MITGYVPSRAVGFFSFFLALGFMAMAASAANNRQQIYLQNCSSCHQANGQGVSGTFPPLAHNSFVTGNPKAVIVTVLNGKQGQITVNGVRYNGQMPAWKATLSDADIASVITYIRSSWGNKADRVTVKQIQQISGRH